MPTQAWAAWNAKFGDQIGAALEVRGIAAVGFEAWAHAQTEATSRLTRLHAVERVPTI